MASFSKWVWFEIQHIKGKQNKVVDALSRNARLNFAAAISTYATDLDEQLKEGIEQDEIYHILQEPHGISLRNKR